MVVLTLGSTTYRTIAATAIFLPAVLHYLEGALHNRNLFRLFELAFHGGKS